MASTAMHGYVLLMPEHHQTYEKKGKEFQITRCSRERQSATLVAGRKPVYISLTALAHPRYE